MNRRARSGRDSVSSSNSGWTGDYERGSGDGCGSSSSDPATANGVDAMFVWSPPADGCYAVDTYGSDYDTVLRLYTGCDGVEVACDDDTYNPATSSRGKVRGG